MAPERTTMASSGKRPVGNADRLSDLPDGLVHHIMSFFTARQAVQTCVLSRRCEERVFHGDDEWDEYDEEDDTDCARFEDFVTNLLMFHRAPILDRFRLHASDQESKFVNSWLRRGIKRCPKVVEIHLTHDCKLPNLGSSSSRLNRLHLIGITLDKTFTRQLPSRCPVLHDLELERCRLDDDAEIVSSTLKNLNIEDCTTENPSRLTIKTPSLTYLKLVITDFDHNWQAVVVDEMPFLIKATISVKPSTAMLACKLLFGLIYVKELELTGLRTLANFHIGSATFPVFHNVRTLLVDSCDLSDSCDILGCFLNNAPCLEKLTLQTCKLTQGSKKSKAGGNASLVCQDTSSFQCPSLKRTEINTIKTTMFKNCLTFCLAFGGTYRRVQL